MKYNVGTRNNLGIAIFQMKIYNDFLIFIANINFGCLIELSD